MRRTGVCWKRRGAFLGRISRARQESNRLTPPRTAVARCQRSFQPGLCFTRPTAILSASSQRKRSASGGAEPSAALRGGNVIIGLTFPHCDPVGAVTLTRIHRVLDENKRRAVAVGQLAARLGGAGQALRIKGACHEACVDIVQRIVSSRRTPPTAPSQPSPKPEAALIRERRQGRKVPGFVRMHRGTRLQAGAACEEMRLS